MDSVANNTLKATNRLQDLDELGPVSCTCLGSPGRRANTLFSLTISGDNL